MKLRFTLLGVEFARIDLDIERDEETPIESVIDEGIKLVSKHWIRRMFR